MKCFKNKNLALDIVAQFLLSLIKFQDSFSSFFREYWLPKHLSSRLKNKTLGQRRVKMMQCSWTHTFQTNWTKCCISKGNTNWGLLARSLTTPSLTSFPRLELFFFENKICFKLLLSLLSFLFFDLLSGCALLIIKISIYLRKLFQLQVNPEVPDDDPDKSNTKKKKKVEEMTEEDWEKKEKRIQMHTRWGSFDVSRIN